MAGRTGVAAVAALMLAACGGTDTTTTNTTAGVAAQPSVLAALKDAPQLDGTERLVKQAGLERMFDGAGSYTLFAPTDAAIAGLPEADRQRLTSADGRPQLIALLRQHIAPGYIGRADIDQGLTRKDGTVQLATVGGAPVTLRKSGDAVVLGGGEGAPRLIGQAIPARNGVIFAIDRVLPPPTATAR